MLIHLENATLKIPKEPQHTQLINNFESQQKNNKSSTAEETLRQLREYHELHNPIPEIQKDFKPIKLEKGSCIWQVADYVFSLGDRLAFQMLVKKHFPDRCFLTQPQAGFFAGASPISYGFVIDSGPFYRVDFCWYNEYQRRVESVPVKSFSQIGRCIEISKYANKVNATSIKYCENEKRMIRYQAIFIVEDVNALTLRTEKGSSYMDPSKTLNYNSYDGGTWHKCNLNYALFNTCMVSYCESHLNGYFVNERSPKSGINCLDIKVFLPDLRQFTLMLINSDGTILRIDEKEPWRILEERQYAILNKLGIEVFSERMDQSIILQNPYKLFATIDGQTLKLQRAVYQGISLSITSINLQYREKTQEQLLGIIQNFIDKHSQVKELNTEKEQQFVNDAQAHGYAIKTSVPNGFLTKMEICCQQRGQYPLYTCHYHNRSIYVHYDTFEELDGYVKSEIAKSHDERMTNIYRTAALHVGLTLRHDMTALYNDVPLQFVRIASEAEKDIRKSIQEQFEKAHKKYSDWLHILYGYLLGCHISDLKFTLTHTQLQATYKEKSYHLKYGGNTATLQKELEKIIGQAIPQLESLVWDVPSFEFHR